MLGSFMLSATPRPSNWIGHFIPCSRSSELSKRDHMDLGVWFNISNPVLAAEFREAMNFWAEVLDMTWHEENTMQCSIQVLDGSPALFKDNITAARSQFADIAKFNGWIAFNPKCRLNNIEMYLTAIHEIGHMLGLQHSTNPKSVMYFLDPGEPPLLDGTDLASLAIRHRLRNNSPTQTFPAAQR